jgi:hypothetical protein
MRYARSGCLFLGALCTHLALGALWAASTSRRAWAEEPPAAAAPPSPSPSPSPSAGPAPAAAPPAAPVAPPDAAPSGEAAAEAAAQADEPPPAGFTADGARARPADAVPFAGVVLEKGTRNPLGGTRVTLTPWRELPPDPSKPKKKSDRPRGEATGEPVELTTDASGRFEQDELAPGTYLVTLRGPLIERVDSVEQIEKGKKKTITYYAPPKRNRFEVVVRAEAVRKDVSEQVITVEELKRIPGTQNDVLKAVQNLPGVARAPFGGGLLVIWGSAPGDTRIYAEGVAIPRAYHFGGFRSTVNSEFVESLTFKPGTYSADYGRGLGGLIDVQTRAPKSDRIHGSVTLDLIDGSVTLEGPITKKLYVAAGARISWIAAFLPLFNTSNFQISPFYWDYQLSLRYRPTQQDDIDVFVFGSTDNVSARIENPDPATNVDIDSKNYFGRARIRWTHRFSSKTALMVMPSIGGDTFRVGFGDGGVGGVALKLDVLQLGYNLRADLRHRFSDSLTLNGGVDFEGTWSSFDVIAPAAGGGNSAGDPGGMGGASAVTLNAARRELSQFNAVRTAPYAIARIELLNKRLLISPQVRLETTYLQGFNGALSRTLLSPEPRLFISGQIVPRYLLVKFGMGMFSQLALPQELNQTFGNPNLEFQRGATYVAGIESEPTPTLFLQGQFFYKDLHLMVVSDPTLRFTNGGLGRVIGGDFLLRQKLWKGLFGWVAYTVSRSERKDRPEQPWRLFRYDQTHILTLVASYKLPWWNLEVGLRFRYVTGNPATPQVGGLRDTSQQTWVPVLGEPYSSRLPDFHQLDLRIDKTWVFNRWKLGLYLDIQNLYNQNNTETVVYGGRQLFQSAPVTGIPFFPNLGLRADF